MDFKTYKEKFENKEDKNNNNIPNEKDETIFDLYMLIIGYIIIISFGVWFHNFFSKIIPSEIVRLSLSAVIVFPLVLYSYYIFHQIHSIREHKSYESLLEEAIIEIETESKISDVIPVILFGVAVLYGSIKEITTKKNDVLKLVAPYLIFSLMFGTITPNIISYLIFDHHDLHRLFVAADFNFIAVSISFGLMITSLLIPFFIVYF